MPFGMNPQMFVKGLIFAGALSTSGRQCTIRNPRKKTRFWSGKLNENHVHMLVSIQSKYSVAKVFGFIIDKAMIHDAWNLSWQEA